MTREGLGADEARVAQQIAARAVRRLDLLEWVMLGGIGVLSLVGGLLVALLLAGPLGFGVRPTWVVASVLLFGVPAAIAVRRMRRDERQTRPTPLPGRAPAGEQPLKENDG